MKRVGLILFGAVVAAGLTASVGLTVLHGGVGLEAKAALAADTDPIDPDPDAHDPIKPQGPVCIALPIFANKANITKECPNGSIPDDPNKGGAIVYYLIEVLRLLNELVGGVIILVLMIAGIQYITSTGDPTNVKKAKGRLVNAFTALFLYLMMFAILNFLVPGGILL